MKKILGMAVALAVTGAIAGGAASALSFNRDTDYWGAGNHQFYVWCTGKADRTATMDGSNAEDAQAKLWAQLKSGGETTCWPVWQGRVS